ncbi:hypothetical protein Cgig2_026167 [Carnegiea gigantea]|uniref:Uncharacterized protein n=1 Tax=Carnegiea gigantea TaxID=171969 RepID=A0A9Q1QC53_9CARY|nr:hypothetical protein Cgig2_026167 [Carnegiea gigantea]
MKSVLFVVATAHALKACPDSPKNVFEVVVEKSGATSLQGKTMSVPLPSAGHDNTPVEHWVTVLPKKRSRLPSAHRKCRILPTRSCFSVPKVTAGETSGPYEGPNSRSEHTKHSSGLEEGLSPLPTFLPDQDSDLPIEEDDEMDIFLNLEGENEPQHSLDSSKKHLEWRVHRGCSAMQLVGCQFGVSHSDGYRALSDTCNLAWRQAMLVCYRSPVLSCIDLPSHCAHWQVRPILEFVSISGRFKDCCWAFKR